MTITRLEKGPRMSQAVIHNDTIYLAGQIGEEGTSVAEQTKTALNHVDRLLKEAGSNKSHILLVIVWLADMKDFDEMNVIYDAWVDKNNPPARAAGEAKLASDGYLVEFIVTAAKA